MHRYKHANSHIHTCIKSCPPACSGVVAALTFLPHRSSQTWGLMWKLLEEGCGTYLAPCEKQKKKKKYPSIPWINRDLHKTTVMGRFAGVKWILLTAVKGKTCRRREKSQPPKPPPPHHHHHPKEREKEQYCSLFERTHGHTCMHKNIHTNTNRVLTPVSSQWFS